MANKSQIRQKQAEETRKESEEAKEVHRKSYKEVVEERNAPASTGRMQEDRNQRS